MELGSEFGRLSLIFLSIFLSAFLILKFRDFKRRSNRRLLPSVPSLPIVGSLPFLKCNGHYERIFREKAKTLGPIFTCRFGSINALIINDRKHLEDTFLRDAMIFSDRKQHYTFENYFNTECKGILSRRYSTDFRKFHQKMLGILKEFGLGQSGMEQRILNGVEELLEIVAEHQGKPFDPMHNITLCSLSVVDNMLFGRRIGQRDPSFKELATSVHSFMHSEKHFVHYFPFLRFLPYYRNCINECFDHQDVQFRFISKGIEAALDTTEWNFVRSYVDKEGPAYDRKDLVFCCMDFIQAGSDTTAATTMWAMVLLANHPQIQKRLHEEIDDALPQADQLPCYSDMVKMPYVEATMLEVLRYKTVTPLGVPHQTYGETELAGYYVPKGIMVLSNLHAIHRDGELWTDPDVFRPDRFLDEAGQSVVGRNRICPFSLGRRSCLGEGIARPELFLMLSSLLKRFEVRPPVGQTVVPCEEIPGLILAPSPCKLRMIPRTAKST